MLRATFLGWQSWLAGLLTCFAGDFLAVARGEVEPRAVVRAMREVWYVPMAASIIVDIIRPHFHPLCQPERVLAQYRRCLGGVAGDPPVVLGKRR